MKLTRAQKRILAAIDVAGRIERQPGAGTWHTPYGRADWKEARDDTVRPLIEAGLLVVDREGWLELAFAGRKGWRPQ